MMKLAITQGDINGIGYEVILKTFEDSRMFELCTPVLYGSSRLAAYYAKNLELAPIPFNVIDDADNARQGVLNIIEVTPAETHPQPGADTPEGGRAALDALRRAVEDIRQDKVDALVTAPINKHNIQSDEFAFAGHTEYLEANAGDGAQSLMILCNDRLRVALVTTHLPIAKVAPAITTDAVYSKLVLFNDSLRRDFGIHSPRIAVLALNPHAGDDGLIGDEERDAITPAIERASAERIHAFGPYPADGFFGSGTYDRFDGVLAMYHDQGLAPFKSLAMDDGINFTAGLPIVRTSPDHGTGYDIAGSGVASPASMRQAVYAAIDIVRAREREDQATANPLQSSRTSHSGRLRQDAPATSETSKTNS